MMRLRPAPSATRTPNSRMRLAARASRRLAALPQAIKQHDGYCAEQQPQERTDVADGAVDEVLD